MRHIASAIGLSIGCFLFGAVPGAAAETQHHLLELVRHDVGLCLEVPQLKARLAELETSPIVERLWQRALVRQWLESKDFQKLKDARNGIEFLTGKPVRQVIDELFGESVVVALYPTANEEPVAVLLTQTVGADVLAKTLAAWNRSENPKIEQREHSGHTYFRRTTAPASEKPGETQHYVTFGRIFVLSDDESMIRQVIDLANAASSQDSRNLLDSPVYRKAKGSLSSECFASIFFNPRPWDAQVLRQKDVPPVFDEIWRACESVAIGLRVSNGIAIEAVAHHDETGAGTGWQRYVEATQGPADFLDRVPRDALVTLAGRHHPATLADLMLSVVPEPDKNEFNTFRQVSRGLLLGSDLFADVLPRFEANWGGYIVPTSDADQETPSPIDGLVAFEIPRSVPQDSDNARPDLRAALDNGLNTGLNLLAAFYNGRSPSKTATVRTERRGTTLIRWMDRFGAYRPTYALTDDYLVLGTSPEVVSAFDSAKGDHSIKTSPKFQQVAAEFLQTENQLVFVNVEELRVFLTRNRDLLVEQAAKARSLNALEVRRRLARLEDVLHLFDAVFVAAHFGRGHIRLVCGAAIW